MAEMDARRRCTLPDALRRRVVAAGLMSLVACAPGTAPSVEAGTGVIAFDPVASGRTLGVVCGSQGGQHIWVALRTLDSGHRLTEATVGLERTDGTPVCGVTLRAVDLVPATDDPAGGALTGLICFIQDPDAIDGASLVLHAEIIDAWGRTASDRRDIVAKAPDPPCR